MKKWVALIIWIFCFSSAFTQSPHKFSFSKDQFLLDGKPFRFISGELHPARIPKEYWRHRIQMTKAMGCNAIAAYVFWNYHETEEGTFDFSSENRNIAEFIKICQEEGMWVLLRPGPYVCAEWDFGGMPPYLLKNPDLKVRCMDTRYMEAVERYIKNLSRQIKKLQCDNGGPILMMQIENEYGSYGNDKEYLEKLRALWLQNGITIPFYTADGPTVRMLQTGNIDGAAIGLDSGSSEADFEQAKKRNPNVPSFSSETYPGWLTHWGEKWARPDTTSLRKEVEFLLRTGRSFNLYVIHGGTNFGLTAGANAFSPTQYQPDITSYDYDAPINEQGSPTPKYFMLRDLISKYVNYKIPQPPSPIPTIGIPPIRLINTGSIWHPVEPVELIKTAQPLPFEMFGQNQGIAIYSTRLTGNRNGGKLTITEPHDYALVFYNRKLIDTIYRDGGKWSVQLPASDWLEDPLLEILVEGMGHINFAQYMIDRKGITDRVTLDGMTIMNWTIQSFPINEAFLKSANSHSAGPVDERQGLFFTGSFSLDQTGDTYFDLSNYQKGYVFINGHNLGRYWKRGPQQRLYCPASWLNKGKNNICVFDLLAMKPEEITAKKTIE